MTKYIHAEGSEAFPKDDADCEVLKSIGFEEASDEPKPEKKSKKKSEPEA